VFLAMDNFSKPHPQIDLESVGAVLLLLGQALKHNHPSFCYIIFTKICFNRVTSK
jgi:hypothetical protein